MYTHSFLRATAVLIDK